MILYVDSLGDDRNAGAAARPLRTLAAALRILREKKPGRSKRIVLRPGLYPDTNVHLGPEDSGLILEGEGPGEAVLCGGVLVTGWEAEGRGRFSAPAPTVAPLDALLLNREFAPQARLPHRGVLRHENEFRVRWLSATAGGWERKPTTAELMHLRCRAGDLPADLRSRNARVQFFHQWDESRVNCAAFDPVRHVITFAERPGHPPGAFASAGNPKAQTYVVWNVAEGLHEPGQWYHDCERGRIVYWPRRRERPESLEAIAPVHQGVLTIRGRAGRPVRDVTVRNVGILAGNGGTRPGGFGAGMIAGAVHLLDVRDIALERLHIHHTAGAGIRRLTGCPQGVVEGVVVRRCHIHDTGGPGVRIDATGRSAVEDCTIEDIGVIHPSSLALSLCGPGSLIRRNVVRRCPYTAIQSAGSSGVRIECNRLQDFMQQLDDGAAIYAFACRGAVCRGNAAYGASGRLAHAYYLDERCADCRVEGNLAVDTASPVHNHMGRNCVHRNNVFLDRGDMTLSWIRCRDFVFRDNILQAGGSIVFRMEPEALSLLTGNAIQAGRGGLLVERLERDGYAVLGREALTLARAVQRFGGRSR